MSEQLVESILAELRSERRDAAKLLRVYRDDDFESAWRATPLLYREFGRKLISAGHFSNAFSISHEGMLRHNRDAELRYLCGLTLARMGDITKAAKFVDDLHDVPDPKLRSDALALAGRLRKDRYLRTDQPVRRARLAKESAEYYHRAYAVSADLFPAINAATMFLLAGTARQARDLADQIVGMNASPQKQDYWSLATLGEAHVIRGELDEAAKCYAQALRLSGVNRADIAAMRRNVLLLHQKVPITDDIVSLFQLGSVVAFSGEMIDCSAGAVDSTNGLPPDPELERLVAESIRDELKSMKATVGYCCPRAGSEIVFAEQIIERGAELHLVLPFKLDDFDSTCVHLGLAETRGWHERFQRVLSLGTVHYATKEGYLHDDILFEFAAGFTQGLAITHAARLGVEPTALMALNTGQTTGYCPCFLDMWRRTSRPYRVIDLGGLLSKLSSLAKAAGRRILQPTLPFTEGALKREIKALLFADVKNFSGLEEEESPLFFAAFSKGIQSVIDGSKEPPTFCNTWGDGLYAVFGHVTAAADFAVRLLEHMEHFNWSDWGLPGDTSVRVGLHVGPVYRQTDPILGKENFFGSHVNRAARIEPVTTPGCAFVSEQFAAALAIEASNEFVCMCVGVESLAKGYDKCPLYWLGRK